MVFVFGVNPPRLVRLFLFFFRLHLDSFIFYAFFIHLGGFIFSRDEATLYEGVSVRRMDGPSDGCSVGWMVRRMDGP